MVDTNAFIFEAAALREENAALRSRAERAEEALGAAADALERAVQVAGFQPWIAMARSAAANARAALSDPPEPPASEEKRPERCPSCLSKGDGQGDVDGPCQYSWHDPQLAAKGQLDSASDAVSLPLEAQVLGSPFWGGEVPEPPASAPDEMARGDG